MNLPFKLTAFRYSRLNGLHTVHLLRKALSVEVKINRRCAQVGMAKQGLQVTEVSSRLEEMGRISMPQDMRMNVDGNAGQSRRSANTPANRADCYPSSLASFDQHSVLAGAYQLLNVGKYFLRNAYGAVTAALTFPDNGRPVGKIDIFDVDALDFADAQPQIQANTDNDLIANRGGLASALLAVDLGDTPIKQLHRIRPSQEMRQAFPLAGGNFGGLIGTEESNGRQSHGRPPIAHHGMEVYFLRAHEGAQRFHPML